MNPLATINDSRDAVAFDPLACGACGAPMHCPCMARYCGGPEASVLCLSCAVGAPIHPLDDVDVTERYLTWVHTGRWTARQ